MTPRYLEHPDRDMRLLLACAYGQHLGDTHAMTMACMLAPDVPEHVVEGVILTAAGLIDSLELCAESPSDYAYTEGLQRGAGVSWVEWAEIESGVLMADLYATVERLLMGVGL
jgi:hypothetical protein